MAQILVNTGFMLLIYFAGTIENLGVKTGSQM